MEDERNWERKSTRDRRKKKEETKKKTFKRKKRDDDDDEMCVYTYIYISARGTECATHLEYSRR